MINWIFHNRNLAFLGVLICSILLPFGLNQNIARAEGNGAGRGGGDEYSAEIFYIARGITKKLRRWSLDGTLKLTPEQISKIESIVDMREEAKDSKQTLLEIYSFERVYKHPELLPTPQADETTLINIYASSPPRIEVGRIRWDLLQGKNIEKEMMVLHELLGAAGILKNNQRLDDQFRISYELKLSKLQEWESFKETLKLNLIALRVLGANAIHPDLSHLKMAGELLENLPQYDQVMHPELYVHGSKNKIETYQLDSFNSIVIWFHKSERSLATNSQASNNKKGEEGSELLRQLAIKLQGVPLTWHNWAVKLFNDYVITHEKALKQINKPSNDDMAFNQLIQNCGDRFATPVDQLLECFVAQLKTGDFMQFQNAEMQKQTEILQKKLEAIFDEIALTLSPDEIPSVTK